MKLTDRFGYCKIPKDTLLFRGHEDTTTLDCMFFSTKQWVASAFNEKIQVWKTTTEIKILFLVEFLNDRSWAISSLPRLYAEIFPLERNFKLDDLDIKHWNIERRDKLVRELFDKYCINGWLTSIEGKIELEVCLFDRQENSKQLELIDFNDRKNKKYFKDSLEKIKIFPTKEFYDKSSEQFRKYSLTKKNYENYKISFYSDINEIETNRNGRLKLIHEKNNLRMKLKI